MEPRFKARPGPTFALGVSVERSQETSKEAEKEPASSLFADSRAEQPFKVPSRRLLLEPECSEADKMSFTLPKRTTSVLTCGKDDSPQLPTKRHKPSDDTSLEPSGEKNSSDPPVLSPNLPTLSQPQDRENTLSNDARETRLMETPQASSVSASGKSPLPSLKTSLFLNFNHRTTLSAFPNPSTSPKPIALQLGWSKSAKQISKGETSSSFPPLSPTASTSAETSLVGPSLPLDYDRAANAIATQGSAEPIAESGNISSHPSVNLTRRATFAATRGPQAMVHTKTTKLDLFPRAVSTRRSEAAEMSSPEAKKPPPADPLSDVSLKVARALPDSHQVDKLEIAFLNKAQEYSKRLEEMNEGLAETVEKLKEQAVHLYALNNEALFMNSPTIIDQVEALRVQVREMLLDRCNLPPMTPEKEE